MYRPQRETIDLIIGMDPTEPIDLVSGQAPNEAIDVDAVTFSSPYRKNIPSGIKNIPLSPPKRRERTVLDDRPSKKLKQDTPAKAGGGLNRRSVNSLRPSRPSMSKSQSPADTARSARKHEPPRNLISKSMEIIDVDADEDEDPAPPPLQVPPQAPMELSDSDWEDEIIGLTHPSPPQSRHVSVASDTDSEDEYVHTVPLLSDAAHFLQVQTNSEKLDEDLVQDVNIAMQDLGIDSSKARPSRAPKITRFDYSQSLTDDEDDSDTNYVWGKLRTMSMSKSRRRQLHSRRSGRVVDELYTGRLPLINSFRRSPGPINKIYQRDGSIAICSNATEGDRDTPESGPSPYNEDGAVLELRRSERFPRVIPGHMKTREDGWPYDKQYSVNDMQYTPSGGYIVSTSTDNTLCAWKYDPNKDPNQPYSEVYCHVYTNLLDVAFDPTPGSTVLAIAEENISIQANIDAQAEAEDSDSEEISTFIAISNRRRRALQRVGPLVWGRGPTAGQIFASTEPLGDRYMDCFHGAFDVDEEKKLYGFADIHGNFLNQDYQTLEKGDEIAIQDNGKLLALATSSETKNIIRIYDVAGGISKKAVQEIKLAAPRCDINCATYSPDGIYLALARSDNATHIYDLRMFSSSSFFSFQHDPDASEVNPGQQSFGIVRAQWIQKRTGRFGLVTGGNDGCVRMWDPLISATDRLNGTIIAEASSDIAYFTIGDRFAGEHQLVVGDAAGTVYIYDDNHIPLM